MKTKTDSDDLRQLEKWRKACYERDEGRCQITGRPADSPHHIIKRKHQEFRYDVDNGICLTSDMHRFVEENPKTGMLLVKAAIRTERLERLREKFKAAYGYDYFEREGGLDA